MKLAYGLRFEDLYSEEGVEKIQRCFYKYLEGVDPDYIDKLHAYKVGDMGRNIVDESLLSEFVIEGADYMQDFLFILFGVDMPKGWINSSVVMKRLHGMNRKFIMRRVMRDDAVGDIAVNISLHEAERLLEHVGVIWCDDVIDFEERFASLLQSIEVDEELRDDYMPAVVRYAKWAVSSERHKGGVLFVVPDVTDAERLVHGVVKSDGLYRHKDGGNMRSDFSFNEDKEALNPWYSANYCIYCHNRGKDSCSKGLVGGSKYRINELGNELHGCPLGQKISEMHYLFASGRILSALIVAMIDNPLIVATGHRICNDCIKSCIYQKQEGVDTPSVESKIVRDVLNLQWGFEIYSLLTRWHPMRLMSGEYAGESRGGDRGLKEEGNVLVVGLGPAGFALSYYLTTLGINVVAIDGMKIEPLPGHISGISSDYDTYGSRVPFRPISNIDELFEHVPSTQGFGGVMEYGITARWEKNYLKIIRLILERRSNFRMYGGVIFGKSMNISDAKRFGIDHIAMAMGAGSAKIPGIKNMLVDGVRMASDFLMQLHCSDIRQDDGVGNMQLLMPIVVIGGGLTALDAATESVTHYAMQAMKVFKKYKLLGDDLFKGMGEQEKGIAKTLIEHGRLLYENPAKRGELLRKWGGVTIIYRKSLQDSPAYKLNHKEVQAAFLDGIEFMESTEVTEFVQDAGGALAGVMCDEAIGGVQNGVQNGVQKRRFIRAKSCLVATGYNQREHIEAHDYVSVFGDMDPLYRGSVVKAIASAKNNVERLVDIMREYRNGGSNSVKDVARQNKDVVMDSKDVAMQTEAELDIFARMDDSFLSYVQDIKKLSDKMHCITVRSKLAAQKFKFGQFFKLQNYTGISAVRAVEPLALTGIKVEYDLISFIVRDIGVSSMNISNLKIGEPLLFSGPSGNGFRIAEGEFIVFISDGVAGHVFEAIAEGGGFDDRYIMVRESDDGVYIRCAVGSAAAGSADGASAVVGAAGSAAAGSAAADSTGSDPAAAASSASTADSTGVFKSFVIEGVVENALEEIRVAVGDLEAVSRVMIAGSVNFMERTSAALEKEDFIDSARVFVMPHSPIQCTMGGVCSHCLQSRVCTESGEVTYVFGCSGEICELSALDMSHLRMRLRQDSVMEKISVNCEEMYVYAEGA